MTYPTPLIMWTWQDEQVENHRVLDLALADIAATGFSGVLAMLRGCRYALSDPMVIDAARHATDRAHRLGLAFWFALDPRLDQGRLTALPAGPAAYLLVGRDAAGTLASETTVDGTGRYRVRLDYGPRSQHMLSQVAITVAPEAVEHAVAYRRATDGTVLASTVRDVTAGARLFVQRAAGYLEIFGRIDPPPDDGWYVLALPRCSSTYPDLGDDRVVEAMCEVYRAYHGAGVRLDGVFWDEIGYVTGFGEDRGRLPWSPSVVDAFAARYGADARAALPYLLLDDDAGRAARARQAYYAAVQDVVLAAQRRCHAQAQALWGAGVDSGIHQTWHQNADDLPHGTGDWWRGSAALSGGFTDVGDAERADTRDEVLAMTAVAAALARHHVQPRAFCNLWGVEYGGDVVDWWAHLLSAFGVGWLVHTYGPNGYIDHATGWGPGYPDHPTWERLGAVSDRIARLREIVDGALPATNLAVVYPIGTLARVGDASANALARDAQRVIATTVRLGLAADVISPDLFAGAEVRDGGLWVGTPRGRLRYDAVVYPHPSTLQPAESDRLDDLRTGGVPAVLIGQPPRESTDGAPPRPRRTAAMDDLDAALCDLPRLVHAPEGCVANLFQRPDGTSTVVATPSEPGVQVTGTVHAAELVAELSGLRGVAAVRVDAFGRPLDCWAYDGSVHVHSEIAR